MEPATSPANPVLTATPKTILFFDHTAQLGGGEIALLNVVRSIDRSLFSPVVVLGSAGMLHERLLETGVETHLLPIARSVADTRKDTLGVRSLLRIGDMARILFYCVKLSRFIRRRQAAIVHTNSLKADIIGGVAARLAGVPVVWHIRDRIADDYLPLPVVGFFRFLCRVIPNAVIANSHATLDSINLPPQRRGNKGTTGTVIYSGTVIYDGIKSSGAAAAGPLQNPEAAIASPRIGLIGRLAPWKGQHIFIRAASLVVKKFPSCKFQIIGAALFGEDDYERDLRALVKTLGLAGQVEFTGFRSDVADLIRRLDVVVHASTVGEPFGQVVIEAMAASKPVVATRGGGVVEIVMDGVTGILVPMGDAESMAGAILKLIENTDMAREMGDAGKVWVEKCFTIEKTARQMEEVFVELLGCHPA